MTLVDLTSNVGMLAGAIVPFTPAFRETFPEHHGPWWYILDFILIWVVVFATTAIIVGILSNPGGFIVGANRAP